MELARRMQENDRADKLDDHISAEDQKSVNKVSSFHECTKES